MVDVSALFARARTLAESAIATSGTEVAFSTTQTTTNPDTLARTDVEGPRTTSRAIVIPGVPAGGVSEVVPGVELRPGDWRIVLPVKVTDPAEDTTVRVTRCKDARLIGKTATVLAAVRSSAGAVLVVYARPGRLT